jgi:hypothetical protein
MRRLLTGAAAGLVVAAWIWLDVSTEYKWGETAKRELKIDGFTITDEHRLGHLGLSWTWVYAPIKQVSFQRVLGSFDGLIYGIDGYLRLGDNDKTEHAAWLRKIDCQGERFAQLSLDKTEEKFEDLEQVETALRNIDWISRASLENEARWQGEWFGSVISDYCY